MNGAETHLLLNHLPVFGTIFGLLALVLGLAMRSDGAKKVGLILLIIAGAFSVPVSNSGEDAEEIVEHMGLGEDMHDVIHEHEEMGEKAMWGCVVTGVLALLAFFMLQTKKAPANILVIVTMAAALVGSIYLPLVAHSGGEIRHTEIRDGFVVPGEDAHQESEMMDND